MTKLYSDVAGKFPGASIIEVHRKYFSETRGLQMVKHLCALEYSSVELQLRHKYYALAAAACLLKYVEFIENIGNHFWFQLYQMLFMSVLFQHDHQNL